MVEVYTFWAGRPDAFIGFTIKKGGVNEKILWAVGSLKTPITRIFPLIGPLKDWSTQVDESLFLAHACDRAIINKKQKKWINRLSMRIPSFFLRQVFTIIEFDPCKSKPLGGISRILSD